MRFPRLGPPPDNTAGGRPSAGPQESARHTGLRSTAPGRGLQPAEPRGTNICCVSCRVRGILPQQSKGAKTEGSAKLQSQGAGLTEGLPTRVRGGLCRSSGLASGEEDAVGVETQGPGQGRRGGL